LVEEFHAINFTFCFEDPYILSLFLGVDVDLFLIFPNEVISVTFGVYGKALVSLINGFGCPAVHPSQRQLINFHLEGFTKSLNLLLEILLLVCNLPFQLF